MKGTGVYIYQFYVIKNGVIYRVIHNETRILDIITLKILKQTFEFRKIFFINPADYVIILGVTGPAVGMPVRITVALVHAGVVRQPPLLAVRVETQLFPRIPIRRVRHG